MAEAPLKGLRLEIATVLNGHPRTLYQTAKAVRRRSGDIQKTLRQMHAEGLLEAEHEPPEPGTRFELAADGEAALVEALGGGGLPGLIAPDRDLLLLRAPSQAALDAVLALGDVTATIAWGVRLGDRTSMLVALAPHAGEGDFRRVSRVIEEAKIEVESFRAASVDDGVTLNRNAIAAAAEAAEFTALAGEDGG